MKYQCGSIHQMISAVSLIYKHLSSKVSSLIIIIIMSTIDPIAKIYSISHQSGAGGTLPYFVGKQYGGGWLQTLARIAFPILRTAVGAAGNIAANTAEDLIEKRKTFTESLKDNALGEASKLFTQGGGTTLKRKSHPATSINSRKKRVKLNNSRTIFGK
jgi:hypothetical protein